MSRFRPAAAALLLLVPTGCGGEAGEATNNPASAAPATEGPEADGRAAGVERRLLPPGAVAGAADDPADPSLTFVARKPPAALLDWFRGTANGADFALESEMQEGAEHVFSGRVRGTGAPFSVRIAPAENGGTTGIVVMTR